MLTHGSVFSGIGGLDLGLEWTGGFRTIWQCEIDDYASRVLKKHWPGIPNNGDMTKIDWSTVEKPDVISGGFPCFPAGTLIRTTNGLIPIEEVKNGEYVLTHKRRYCPVRKHMGRITEEIYKIKIKGHPILNTTSEHPLYCMERKRKWNNKIRRYRFWFESAKWVNASELTTEHYIASPLIESYEESDDKTVDFWYFVGRYLGDGWIVNHKRTSTIPQGKHGSRGRTRAGRVTRTRTSDCRRQGQREGAAEQFGQLRGTIGDSEEVADTDGEPWPERNIFQGSVIEASYRYYSTRPGIQGGWATEPPVDRVASGVPNRVDRLRCIGNSVVPQVAEAVGYMLLEFDARCNPGNI